MSGLNKRRLMYLQSAKEILLKSLERKSLSIDNCKYLKELMTQSELDIEDRLAISILEHSIWKGVIEVEN